MPPPSNLPLQRRPPPRIPALLGPNLIRRSLAIPRPRPPIDGAAQALSNNAA